MSEYYKPADGRRGIKGKGLVVFIITGVVSLGCAVWGFITGKNPAVLGELKISYSLEEKRPTPTSTIEEEKIIRQVKEQISGDEGTYGIYVSRLNSGEEYGLNVDEKFPLMSIGKVPIMVAAYKRIEANKLALSDRLTWQEEQIDIEATDSATPTIKKVAVTMSVEKMLSEMGKRSNNYAAGRLVSEIGKERIQEVISNDLNMKDTSLEENITTVRDVGKMWKTLAGNTALISPEHKSKLWEDLQDSIYEDRIYKGIPRTVQLVHKVGTDEDVWNDSGILTDKDTKASKNVQPLVVVILNDGVDLDEAKKTVPDISKMIWEYEKQRS
jgi:beta-lactamase class A